MVLLAILAAAAAVALVIPGPRRVAPAVRDEAPPTEVRDLGPVRRWRWLWAAFGALGAALFLGGVAGLVGGAAMAAVVWVVAGRAEPRDVRRRREAVVRDLPHVVALLGAALRSGLAPGAAITLVGRALPGAAASSLRPVAARLELGADPVMVWQEVAADPALGPLGRTLARTHRTGAPVVAAIDRLADELAGRARAEVEDRARAVGVRAAVPLGLCFLPAFILIGIVPVVAGLVGEIGL